MPGRTEEDGNEVELCEFIGADDNRLLTECFAIRREVFMEEQNVDETLEFDGFDDQCTHILARSQNGSHPSDPSSGDGAGDGSEWTALGTCRLRRTGPFIKLERVAVRKSARKTGLGERICSYAIKVAERRDDGALFVTQAQLSSIGLYEKLGFVTVSDVYVEAGIEHQTMMYWPRRELKLELDSWNYEESHLHPFIPGECFDPAVMNTMRERIRIERERTGPRLMHLRFEVSEAVVGRSLLRTYRECVLATQRCEYERSEKLEAFLLSVAWEKLNTGHYSQVNDAWRALYAATSACKARRLLEQYKYEEALRACDMGLIMGGDVDNRSLSSFAMHIHSLCEPPAPLVARMSVSDAPEPLRNSQWIRRVDRPSLEEFCEYLMRGEPVVITGIVTEWPAFSKWSFDYLNSKIGHRTVPIEVGSSYADDGWSQTLMKISDFMHQFVEEESARGVGYLAQHRLFDQIPELLDDVVVPDYCAFGEDSLEQVDLNIWIGPAGTVSPLHTDPKSNIFCQVRGKKFLRLVPYSETDDVYPNQEGFLTNTSQVDVAHPDESQFPLFKSAHVLDCVLSPGECLFIPVAYWHYVKSLEPSISVSCWFRSERHSK